MQVLITGATGFIGRALTAALLQRGDSVVALTRSVAAARGKLPADVQCIESLDLAGPADAVVNLAGENLFSGRWNGSRKRRLVDSRVNLTNRLVDWMRKAPPRVLVSGSAIGWYGARGDEVLAEDARPGRDDEFQVQLCRSWEAAAAQAERIGVRTCLLRTGVVLERDGGALQQMLLPFRLGLGGPMGSGRQWMSWIHRADHVALTMRLIDDDSVRGAVNATAPEPVRHGEFVRTLARELRRPAFLRVPAPVLRLVVGEMAELIVTGQRVVPQRAGALGFDFTYPRLDAALRAILARATE